MKEKMTEKERFESVMQQIDEEHKAWLDFFSSQNPEDLTRRLGSSNWSAVDTLVHITSWQANALKVAQDMASGKIKEFNPNSSPAGVLHININKFNGETIASHEGWTPDQALKWNAQVFAELRDVIIKLPTEKLFGGRGYLGACMWYGMPTIIHSKGHRRAAMRSLGIPEV